MKTPAFRYVTVDSLQVSSALATARCPQTHPGSHRLHPTVPGQNRCGCSRRYTDVQVVELAREQSFVERAFDMAAERLARDPHGLQLYACLALIDDAFDSLEYMAGEFGVWL